jgi:predicted PurR-regulated permease PerM
MFIYNKFKDKNILNYLLLLISIYVLYLVKNILTPFALGVVFAYSFKNIVAEFEKKYPNRVVLSVFITIITWSIIIITFIKLAPFIGRQTIELGKDIISFIDKNDSVINEKINYHLSYFNIKIDIKDNINSVLGGVDKFIINNISNLFSTSLAILNFLYIFIVAPITMYYILKDWNKIISFFKKYIPYCSSKKSQFLFLSIDSVLSACIKEQLKVCFILGLFYSIALAITGLKYSFLIGMFSGLATFLPYIGIITGMIIGIIMTMYQWGFDGFYIILVFSIFMGGLLLEMNYLLPKFVGRKIELHPLLVIFSMVACGSLWGFYGLLLSLPIAGVISVLVRFYFKKK